MVVDLDFMGVLLECVASGGFLWIEEFIYVLPQSLGTDVLWVWLLLILILACLLISIL